MHPEIKIKRIYEQAEQSDGYRILVDRLWPRGLSKEKIEIDEWAKDIAPSTVIRLAYGHIPEHWELFQNQYHTELTQNEAIPMYLEKWEDYPTITLLSAAKDQEHSNAILLQQYLIKCYADRT